MFYLHNIGFCAPCNAYLVSTTTDVTISVATTSIPDTMQGTDATVPIHDDGMLQLCLSL